MKLVTCLAVTLTNTTDWHSTIYTSSLLREYPVNLTTLTHNTSAIYAFRLFRYEQLQQVPKYLDTGQLIWVCRTKSLLHLTQRVPGREAAKGQNEGWNKTHTKAQPVRPDKMYWKWRKTAALRPLKDLRLNCYVRAALNKRAAPAPAAAAATTVDGGGGGDGPVAINVAAAGATLATKWKPFTSSQSCEQKRKNSFIQSFIHSCIQHCCTHHLSLSPSLSLSLVGSQLVRLVFYVVTTCRRAVLWGGSLRDLSGFVLPF